MINPLACQRPQPSPLAGLVASTGGAPPFSPSDLSSMVQWLAADGTLWQNSGRTTPATASTDPVGSWDDASGLGHHALQATVGNRPKLQLAVVNGRPVVRFDGLFSYLQVNWTQAQPVTTFVVAKHASPGSPLEVLIDGTVFDSAEVRVSNGGDATKWDVYAGNFLTRTLPITGSFQLITIVWNGASSLARNNGAAQSSGDAGTTAPNGITIGAFPNGTRNCAVDVAEIIQYARVLSSTEYGQVEAYLNGRYLLY